VLTHQGDDFDSAFTSHFEGDLPESINTDHHLVVVASGIDTSSEQIVDYLRGYRVPINVLFFEYLQDGDREYLARSWLSDPEIEASSGASGKKLDSLERTRLLRRGWGEPTSQLG
jgi:hypothetical protein